MPVSVPSVSLLARNLGLSKATVSNALRGTGRVAALTRQRVRKAADAAGYRHNPLAASLMSEMRRSRGRFFRGVLAVVIVDEPDRPAHSVKYFEAMLRGAEKRAAQLGFQVATFKIGGGGVSLRRLDTILQSRGIAGLLLFPTWKDPDFSGLNWSRYSAVYVDYIIENPTLHSICTAHYRSFMGALHRLHALGYRRPGLVLQQHQDERIQHRWESGMLVFQRHAARLQRVPTLILDSINRADFIAWFRRHRPDIVLGHHSEMMGWMRSCGAKIPRTHGFFCLNLLAANTPCTGLDQQPWVIGARAAELLIGQLHRNEFGIPEHPSLTTIPARWVDGQTISMHKLHPAE